MRPTLIVLQTYIFEQAQFKHSFKVLRLMPSDFAVRVLLPSFLSRILRTCSLTASSSRSLWGNSVDKSIFLCSAIIFPAFRQEKKSDYSVYCNQQITVGAKAIPSLFRVSGHSWSMDSSIQRARSSAPTNRIPFCSHIIES